MLVVHDRRPLTPWADTFVAYQSLTLIVVVAGILFLVWRIGRHSPAARRDAIASGGAGDAPSREADFVVETFQTVIGELQHKGKELELRSQRDRERADRSERFAERVIAQMPTGLVVVDRSGCVTAANQSARDLFAGLPSGRSEAVVQERVFESAPGLSAMIAGCLAEGQSFQRREVELRAQTGDGSSRCLGVSVTPIGPAGGPVEAALALMTDLTEVVELRDRVRAQETSLATIQGYAQLLAGMDVERAAEPSEALMTEVRALSQMVTDFLNFAKPQDLSLAPVRIRDVIEAIVDRFGDRLASSGIEAVISGDAAGGSATVWADEMLLSRAILNLFQNAIEALEEIDGPRKIEISVRESGPTELTLEIRDNGPGIPPEDLSRVFIPFFTTRSRGYGIGLALTQKIIFAHGGRITVENADPGAVFRCRLPSGAGRPTA
jgi:signal transduction histidine kinase